MSNTRKAQPYLADWEPSFPKERPPKNARFTRWLMAASAAAQRKEWADKKK